jgi:hypothetical protein
MNANKEKAALVWLEIGLSGRRFKPQAE